MLLISKTSWSHRQIADRYRIRWYTECLFKHLKSNGFEIEELGMTSPTKIRLLIAIVTVVYVLFVGEGFREFHRIRGKYKPCCCGLISPGYVASHSLVKQHQRLSNVFAYLMEHFTSPVSLGEVAQLAHMNEAAFCRYFKGQTGKTLTQYLSDLRIRYACELLSKGEDSVTQVCFQAGFKNVSHFIQTFKKQRHQTPFEFRKQANR